MKKLLIIVALSVVSLPLIASDFLRVHQEEKNKETEVIQNKEEDLKDSLNTPNYKPKSDNFTVIDEAPPVPPDPFENFRMNKGLSEAGLEYARNKKPNPFLNKKEPEPIPVLDYKPAKNGEYLYERLNHGEEINVQLPPKVGRKAPIKLKFEPNPENMDSIESFKIISLDGEILTFDTFDRKTVESEKAGLYVFKDLNNKGHNSAKIIYDTVPGEVNYISLSINHIKTGSFRASIDVKTKKGYIYKYKPVPSRTKYGRDFVIPEDFNN